MAGTIAAACAAAVGGCTSMRDLQPAIEANRTNVDELASNVATLARQIRPLVESAWNSEIESRRTAVLLQLQQLTASYRNKLDALTGAQINKDLADPDNVWKADNDRLGPALAAAAGDAEEMDRLQGEHPVLSAIALMKVTPDQVAAHAKLLRGERGVRSVRTEVTEEYPYVARAVAAKAESLQKIDDYIAVTEKQLQLAKAHADLFDFASRSNINVEKAFGAVISDEGLQGQVLGLIKDDRWKSSAADGIGLVKSLLDRGAKAEANKDK